MKNVWIASDCIVSPLGYTTPENYQNIFLQKTGIRKIESGISGSADIYGSFFRERGAEGHLTRFESLAVEAGRKAIAGHDLDKTRTILILTTTKGNVEFLAADAGHARLSLHASARQIAGVLGLNESVVVSNACISGVLGLLVAKRMLSSGRFNHALVVGAEVISPFIISGFRSLRALSEEPCRPFDKNRAGLTLGEGAGAVLLTTDVAVITTHQPVRVAGGGVTNDANHISGPSRTGKELAWAINLALKSAKLHGHEIDAISAHGTATVYNDEMEAKAFFHAGLQDKPLNGLKGYFGHTLGASGVIETIIATHALLNDELPGTLGFSELGVSCDVNVHEKSIALKQDNVLKTASGFGGCNAALVLMKHENGKVKNRK